MEEVDDDNRVFLAQQHRPVVARKIVRSRLEALQAAQMVGLTFQTMNVLRHKRIVLSISKP